MSALGIMQRHILLLDDHVQDRQALKQGLEELGFVNISEAADPISALDVMHTQSVDVLITEQYIPFIRFLRTSAKRPAAYIPIIMVCEKISISERQDAIDAGVNRVISKPTIAEDLCVHITFVLENPPPFVESAAYFGPDRRRLKATNANDTNEIIQPEETIDLSLTPEEIAILLERT